MVLQFWNSEILFTNLITDDCPNRTNLCYFHTHVNILHDQNIFLIMIMQNVLTQIHFDHKIFYIYVHILQYYQYLINLIVYSLNWTVCGYSQQLSNPNLQFDLQKGLMPCSALPLSNFNHQHNMITEYLLYQLKTLIICQFAVANQMSGRDDNETSLARPKRPTIFKKSWTQDPTQPGPRRGRIYNRQNQLVLEKLIN